MSGKQAPQSIDLKGIVEFLEITAEEAKTQKVILKKKEDVYYLVLNNKLNTFNYDFLRLINDKLDEVEASEGEATLVTFGLNNKFFSTGMDLNFITGLNHNKELYFFVLELIHLYGRISAFPMPTIAMVNGHAIAGGLMLAFAHDYVLMRDDFGQVALTEVELGMPLPPGMNAVIQHRTGNTNEYRKLVLTGKRYGPKQMHKFGWIDEIYDPKDLFNNTRKLAESLKHFGTNRVNYKKLKSEINKNVIDMCWNHQHATGVKGEVAVLFKKPNL